MEEDLGLMHIHFFDTLESTNLYAQEGIKNKKIISNCTIAAKFQSSGKGQRSSKWMSKHGENLLFSLVLFHKNIYVDQAFYISKITSLALQEFLSNMTEGQVKIKWPNDLYIGRRKVAGILIENNILGNKINTSVIGIGLNVNQSVFEPSINATSIFLESGQTYNLTELLESFIEYFRKWLKFYQTGEKKIISKKYISQLYGMGERRNFMDEDGIFNGKIIYVEENGQIRLRKENGFQKIYDVKEIQFID